MSELEIVTETDGSNPDIGDIRIENGDIVWLDPNDTKAVAQRIEQRLRSVLGDWYLDLTEGIPWFQSILGSKTGETNARKYIRKAIIETPGVVSLENFETSFDPTTRELSVYWKARFTDNKTYESDEFQPLILKVR